MRARFTAIIGLAVLVALASWPSTATAGRFLPPALGPGLRAAADLPGAPPPVITILPSCTVDPTGSVLSQSGSTYTLTASYVGSIVDECNGSRLDGAGFTLTTYPGSDQGLSILGASNVYVTGLNVTNSSTYAYVVNGATNVTLQADAIGANPGFGLEAVDDQGLTVSSVTSESTGSLQIADCTEVTLRSNVLSYTTGIEVSGSSGVSIQDNNVSMANGDSITVTTSSNVSIDGNTLYQSSTANHDNLYLFQDTDVEASGDRGSNDGVFAALDFVVGATLSRLDGPFAHDVGLEATDSSNLTIQDDNFSHATTYAVSLDSVSHADLINLSGTSAGSEGAAVSSSSDLLFLDDNFSQAAADGLYATDSGNITITSVTASHLTGLLAAGFVTSYCSDLVLSGDQALHDYYGYFDQESSGVSLSQDAFGPGDANGIHLDGDSAVTISTVNATGAGIGIAIFDANQVSVSDSVVSGATQYGLDLQDSTGVSIVHVDANRSSVDGMDVYQCTGLTVSDFWSDGAPTATGLDFYYLVAGVVTAIQVEQEEYGVVVASSSELQILGGNFSSDHEGLQLTGSTTLSVAANTFWNDTDSFADYGGNQGTIDHNNFLGDRGWVLNTSSYGPGRLLWNAPYPTGGNYWSNYTGTDTESGPAQNQPGSDGIGDTPFALNASTEDQYPLVHPWASATITFTETGLPPGTAWTVSVNGQPALSHASALVVLEEDGAIVPFHYAVAPITGYRVSPASGSGTEDNQNVLIALTFSPVNVTLTFAAAGVAAGTPWSVAVDGTVHAGSGPSIIVDEPNGTYAYVVGGIPGYTVTPTSGSVTVAGATTVTLGATALLFDLTFSETGLASGSSWSVTVNGVTKSSTSSSITFEEPNGRYTFSIGSVGGYSVTPASGTVTVIGSSSSVGVAYAGGIFTGTSLGLLVGLIVVAIAALAGWVLYLRRRGPRPRGPLSPAEIPPGASMSPNPPGPPAAPPPP
jgi:hypothetical protein